MSILAASPLPPNVLLDSPQPLNAELSAAPLLTSPDAVDVLGPTCDPVLTGLASAVKPSSIAILLGIRDPASVSTEVVAFRSTERATVRVTTPEKVFYVKVVAPSEVTGLVARHNAALAVGVPAPTVRHAFDELGIVVLEEIDGPLLRDEIKGGRLTWPEAVEFNRLAQRLGRIDTPFPSVPSRVGLAILQAGLLQAADNVHDAHLDRLCEAFQGFASEIEPQVIHGDLQDGKVIVRSGRIAGVLDLDDLGIGSPLEERASLIGFLRYRAIKFPARHGRISNYADHLRSNSSKAFDRDELDTATAAVLVGLATRPFRTQHPAWRHTVSTLVECASSLLPARTVRANNQDNRIDVGGGNGGNGGD